MGKEYITKVRSYFEELISTLKELEDKQLDLKSILKHPKLPIYFCRNHASWIEGSRYHTGWLNRSIIYWYKKLTRQKSSRDACMLARQGKGFKLAAFLVEGKLLKCKLDGRRKRQDRYSGEFASVRVQRLYSQNGFI